MTKRSYYTTPGLVLTALITMGTFVYSHNTGQYELFLKEQTLQQSFSRYAEQVQKIHTIKNLPVAAHIETPESVRAIYISSWVAGTSSLRNKLIDFISTSEINLVIIDIKD